MISFYWNTAFQVLPPLPNDLCTTNMKNIMKDKYTIKKSLPNKIFLHPQSKNTLNQKTKTLLFKTIKTQGCLFVFKATIILIGKQAIHRGSISDK